MNAIPSRPIASIEGEQDARASNDPATLRDEAADIRRIATGRIEWAKGREVLKRYAEAPEALQSIVNSAQNATRGAERLEQYAKVLEERQAMGVRRA